MVGDNTARAQAFEAEDLDTIQSPLSLQNIGRLADDGRFDSAVTGGSKQLTSKSTYRIRF